MSYRPPEQSIEDPAREVIAGMDKFIAAVEARIASGEWQKDHIADLTNAVYGITSLKYFLLQLAEETW